MARKTKPYSRTQMAALELIDDGQWCLLQQLLGVNHPTIKWVRRQCGSMDETRVVTWARECLRVLLRANG